jgi:hypothetical protein
MIGIKPPPLWTSMNAVHDYERTMTQTYEVFNYYETGQLKTVKNNIEQILPQWMKQNSDIVIAGGCWASELQGEKYKDIDIFVLGDPSYPDLHERKQTAIRELMKAWIPSIENNTLEYVRNNDKVEEVWTSKKQKFQIIFTKHLTRKDLINDFDYVHCMTSYSEGKLYITRKIYDAIIKKHLIVQNSKNIQEWRENKFLDRGYTGVFKEKEAPTLGDILSSALRNNAKIVANGGGAGGYSHSIGGGGGGYIVPTTWIQNGKNKRI